MASGVTGSAKLYTAEGAFFREHCCGLYAQVGPGALGQMLLPLPPGQLPLHGGEHHRTHATVVLARMPAQAFVKGVRYVAYAQGSDITRIA